MRLSPRAVYAPPMAEDGRFSVTEITSLIKNSLEGTFPDVLVEGEISNCRPSSTGHLYFTLKDSGAALQAVMFKNRLRSLSFEPRDGELVRARGGISVYALRGSYQLICESLRAAGTGDILAMLEERKRRLAAEGLFDEERKRPLPRYPERVGVVTAATGAAVRDVLNILRRRAPGVDIVVLPCPVQGSEAAPAIAARIRQANERDLADVLIVGRGGGSLEDLLPFSDEAVVRAVAASRIPVVSAVGHEVDWALSDFAADLRAPTPSAAAELVCADLGEALRRIQALKEGLAEAMDTRLQRGRLLVRTFEPENLELRFRALLQPALVRFDDAKEELLRAISDRAASFRARAREAAAALEASNPLDILERGYAIVTEAATGRTVRDARTLAPGARILVRPHKGILDARVESVGETKDASVAGADAEGTAGHLAGEEA